MIESLANRLRRHAHDLVNGGTNASELRADLILASERISNEDAAWVQRASAAQADGHAPPSSRQTPKLAAVLASSPQQNWLKLFLSKLPDLSAPEILLEEDGDLCCDWDGLTVSVSDAGRVGWAALFGDHKSSGHFMLPDWPEWWTEILGFYQQHEDRKIREGLASSPPPPSETEEEEAVSRVDGECDVPPTGSTA